MHFKQIPGWVYVGGVLLTMMAGCVNAVGFLSVNRQALSHMSGMMTSIGMSAAQAQGGLLLHGLAIVAAFFIGGMLSGFILRESSLHVGRRYGLVLAIEALFLALAAIYMSRELNVGDYLAALACGLQNGMASSYSGAVIRTTHCTGMITDLGIVCGQALSGRAVEWTRFRLYGVLLSGFALGSCLGALGFSHYGPTALFFPAAAAGLSGLAYAGRKHYQRMRQAAARRDSETPALAGGVPSPIFLSTANNPSLLTPMSSDFLSARVIGKALDRLDSLATEAGLIVEVALCHGRVFVVAYQHHQDLAEARRQVASPQSTLELLRIVSRELRLPSDWLHQDLRYHLALQAARGSALREPLRSNLVISVAAPALLLAMKLHAYNAAPLATEADPELAFLIEKSGLDSVEAVEQAYSCYYPAGNLARNLRGVVAGLIQAA